MMRSFTGVDHGAYFSLFHWWTYQIFGNEKWWWWEPGGSYRFVAPGVGFPISQSGNVIGSLARSSSASFSISVTEAGVAALLRGASCGGGVVRDGVAFRELLLGDTASFSRGGVPFLPLMRTLFLFRGDLRGASGSMSDVGVMPVTPFLFFTALAYVVFFSVGEGFSPYRL